MHFFDYAYSQIEPGEYLGVLECGSLGVVESRSLGVMESRSLGVEGFKKWKGVSLTKSSVQPSPQGERS